MLMQKASETNRVDACGTSLPRFHLYSSGSPMSMTIVLAVR